MACLQAFGSRLFVDVMESILQPNLGAKLQRFVQALHPSIGRTSPKLTQLSCFSHYIASRSCRSASFFEHALLQRFVGSR